MPGLDPPCLDGKEVFLSKPKILVNLDESLIVEVDVVITTLVFRRKQGAIDYRGAFRDSMHGDRVHRVRYAHELPESVLSLARDRVIDACAEHEGEPQTERRGPA